MSININELKRSITHIEECDDILKLEWLSDKSVSSGMRDAINFAILQRRANLIEKLRSYGVDVGA